ncbi:hypothetical protein BH24ACT5_BH24ACT5_24530 [soil metagenome]
MPQPTRPPITLEGVSDEIELRLAWSQVAPPGDRSDEVFDDVVGRHRQAHRHYHGVRHVVWVIRHVQAIAATHDRATLPFDMGVTIASAFFHDAVYHPRATDNEERSTELATRQLYTLGWPAERVALVGNIIVATAGHLDASAVDGSPSAERDVVLDADLAVLGSDPPEDAAYIIGVRAEYAHLDDEQWRDGRRGVLTALLSRAMLYRTEPARTWWDEQARANMTAERAALSAH